jgi:hypothetical protein
LKIDWKPTSDAKVKLFANYGEAIVFWLSLAGLLFLAILVIFRYSYLRSAKIEFHDVTTNYAQTVQKVEELSAELGAYQRAVDSLEAVILGTKLLARKLELDLAASKTRAPAPAPAVLPETRSQKVLEEFQIHRPQP